MGWFTYALPQAQENITQYCATSEEMGGMGRIGHVNTFWGGHVCHVIHKDGHEGAMKVIPNWDKMTLEQKDRIMGEVETLQVVEIRRHRNIPKIRDHFIVKGNVEGHLYGKKYVHTQYVPQAQRPKPDAAPEFKSKTEELTCGESYCIVFELFKKGTLADDISKRKADNQPYTEPDVWKGMAELCHAIGKMHWEKPLSVPTWLHRNVMPSNIWIHDQDYLMLGDFTVAGPASEKVEFTEKEKTKDKLMFWPPERLNDVQVDDKCDVYMLGAVLYNMMALRPPFESESVLKLLKMVNEEAPEPFSTACTNGQKYSKELMTLVMFMLHKDPKVRPSIVEVYSCLHVFAPEMSEEMFRKHNRYMSWGINKFPKTIKKMQERFGEPIESKDDITLPDNASEIVFKTLQEACNKYQGKDCAKYQEKGVKADVKATDDKF